MADKFDINSVLNEAYRGLDPTLLEGKQDYFQAITQAAIQAIMSDPSLTVNDYSRIQSLRDVMKTHGLDLPTLDSEGTEHVDSESLMKLLMYLQVESEDKLSEVQQKRLDSEKQMLEVRHADTRDKINKNLQAMEEAESTATLSKWLGWTGFAVALAVAIVITIATCGAAAGAAGAGVTAAGSAAATAGTTGAVVGGATASATAATGAAAAAGTTLTVKAMVLAWVSAAIALTQQVLNETGDMEEVNDWASQKLQDWFGVKKEDADLWGEIIVGVAFMAAALGTGAAGAASSLPTAVTTLGAKMGVQITESAVKMGVFIGTNVLGLTSMTVQGFNISNQYDSAMTSADVTESKAMIALIQQMIEESQEELQEIIEKIDNVIAKMFDIISSSMDAEKEISLQMGQMA